MPLKEAISGRILKPETFLKDKTKNYILLAKDGSRKMKPDVFKEVCSLFDIAIDSLVGDIGPNQNVVWGKLASIAGHSTQCITEDDADFIWQSMINAIPDDVECMKAMGGFLMWRFSLREENWICYKDETNEVDFFGNQITVNNYFISDQIVKRTGPKVISSKKKATQAEVLQLAAKFNRK
jgi:hypothetical protein